MLPTLALILAKLKSKSFGINSSIALANKIGEKAFIEKLSIIFFYQDVVIFFLVEENHYEVYL